MPVSYVAGITVRLAYPSALTLLDWPIDQLTNGIDRLVLLEQTKLLAVDPCRTLRRHLLGEVVEGHGRFALGVADHQWYALIAAFTQHSLERDLPQQRDPEVARQQLATAAAEDLVASAVVAAEPTHVLDDPAHR